MVHMVALAVIALWLAICACFAVSAAIIGMPPQTIAHTVVMASLNFAAIMTAISVAVLLGVRPKHEAGEPNGSSRIEPRASRGSRRRYTI